MDDEPGGAHGLAPVELTDKPLFDYHLSTLKEPLSDYSFAGTYMWSRSLNLRWAVLHRHLCVFANSTGDLTMYYPPLPAPDVQPADLDRALEACFEIMNRYNDAHAIRAMSRIEYASDELARYLSGNRFAPLVLQKMSGDYIYETARMIDLAGGALKSKRTLRNKFVRDYPDCRMEPLSPGHTRACLDLLGRWYENARARHADDTAEAVSGADIMRERELSACEIALNHAEPLGLRGMALFAGDALAGFTVGERLTQAQSSIVIEKTLPGFAGAPQFIFSEFCRQYWADCPECNAGDDCDIPSLQFTKESYRPLRRLNKYILRTSVPVREKTVPQPAPADTPLLCA